MADGIAVVRDGHRTWLKWHRARKQAGDLPFTGERILEGLRLGASVEVDLVRHADGGFAVLHDFSLDRDTTGSGLVADTSAAVLRSLTLRDADGAPTSHHPMLLEDLCALLARGDGFAPDGIVQLDLKEEDPAVLGPREVAAFAAAVTPVARHFILSGGNAETVGMLADAVPALAVGYDPCHGEELERVLADHDFATFVIQAVGASPRARMIYLEHRLVLFATEHGFDIVAACHDANRTVDAYTLTRTDAGSVAIARRLLDLGIDQITTDDPAGLEAALAC